MLAFYAWWYPTRFLGWGRWPRYAEFGRLATHLRFVERSSRRLARASFHGMLRYQAGLQNKQAFLFRLVDIANEAFAIAATVSRAQALVATGAPEARDAVRMADTFCLHARRRAKALFRDLWSNDDALRYRSALDVLNGRHVWLEAGIMAHEPAATSTDRAAQRASEPSRCRLAR